MKNAGYGMQGIDSGLPPADAAIFTDDEQRDKVITVAAKYIEDRADLGIVLQMLGVLPTPLQP